MSDSSVVLDPRGRPRFPFMPHAGFSHPLRRDSGYRAYATQREAEAAPLLAQWEHELGASVVASMVDPDPFTVLAFLKADDRANGRERVHTQPRPARATRKSRRAS